jgi:hypothetical protein
MPKPSRKGMTQAQVLLMHGVRSGLEESVCKDLQSRGVSYEYETLKLKYTRPAKEHTYTPDILLPNNVILELKGRLTAEDRKKMLLVKKDNPDLDIRFVFSNSRTKINKNSKTTYADWAAKNGFPFCDKTVPDDWITE